ncbi:MAG: hypothetical protein AAGL29_10975 [Bacteroidota bacterium]
MEKFDKLMREKLEERQIKPSNKAWEKISEQLPSEKKQKTASRYMLMLAACFIGMIVLTIAFWNSDEPSIDPINEIVNTPEIEVDPKLKSQEKVVEILPLENSEVTTVVVPEVSNNQEIVKSQSEEEADELNALAFVKESGELLEQPTLDAIELKAKEILHTVEELERSSDVAVTDAEIDALLRTAQREIFIEKNILSEEGVDAMALLNEVEQEIDGTFRDQIFDALKEGYLKLRTAVADRNN